MDVYPLFPRPAFKNFEILVSQRTSCWKDRSSLCQWRLRALAKDFFISAGVCGAIGMAMARPGEREGNSTTDNRKQAKQLDGRLDVRQGVKIQRGTQKGEGNPQQSKQKAAKARSWRNPGPSPGKPNEASKSIEECENSKDE